LRREKIVAVLGMGNKATDYNQRGIRAVTYLADVAWEIAERKRAEAGHGGLALLEATVRDETEGKQTAGHSRAKRPFKSKGAGNAR
jgi:hypothetical protein